MLSGDVEKIRYYLPKPPQASVLTFLQISGTFFESCRFYPPFLMRYFKTCIKNIYGNMVTAVVTILLSEQFWPPLFRPKVQAQLLLTKKWVHHKGTSIYMLLSYTCKDSQITTDGERERVGLVHGGICQCSIRDTFGFQVGGYSRGNSGHVQHKDGSPRSSVLCGHTSTVRLQMDNVRPLRLTAFIKLVKQKICLSVSFFNWNRRILKQN